ncbi:hypothetical protein Golob_007040, partial [Gossypium lobatum]|nr:hypothetical protein [Gossypium lobatum]
HQGRRAVVRGPRSVLEPCIQLLTFGNVDLVPTVEEYRALLRCSRFQVNKAYFKAVYVLAFWKKLMNITGMTHLDAKKKVDLFALSIYGLMIFPRALGYVDETLEEEKRHLRLDASVQKLEAKKLRKGKNKAKEDLDSLKTDYKKLHLSIRTTGLGKTSEQWRQEIQEERNIADRWERKFHEAQI